MAKGILGVKKDPRNPTLYFLQGDDWPSDDSNDSDYTTKSNKKKAKISKRCQKNQDKRNNDEGELTAFLESSESGNIILKCRKVYKSLDKHKKTIVKKRRKNASHEDDRTEEGLGAVPKVKRKRKRKISTLTTSETPSPPQMDVTSKKELLGELSPESWFNCHWGDGLAYDVLLKIFKYVVSEEGALPFLHRASEISYLWSEVAQHPSLWTEIDLSSSKGKLTELEFLSLCEEGKLNETRQINLSGWEAKFSFRVINAIADFCPALTSINLSRCEQVTGTVIKLLADKCLNLTCIALSQMPHPSSADSPVSCNSFRYLMSKCGSKLTTLNISGNVIRGLNGLVPIFAESCHELRSLDMSDISATDRGIIPIHIEKLQNGCTKLQVLRLANVMMRLANVPLTEQAASPGFPDLEELSIAKVNDNFYQGLDNCSLDRILKSSQKLKILDIRRCSNITASGLVRIQAWDLEQLHMSQCTGCMTLDLELVMQKWSHSLVIVDLSWNNQAGEYLDLAVKSLAEANPNECLIHLNLCGSSVAFVPVKTLLCNCPTLVELNLQSCRGLPRGLKRLYSGEELERFREDVIALKYVDSDDD